MVNLQSGLLLLGGAQAALGFLPGPRDAGAAEHEAASPVGEAPGAVTPQPALPNMAKDCTRFHLVQSGDTCWQIAARYGVETAQFLRLNPSAGPGCRSLWAGYYSCVGVKAKRPTRTEVSRRAAGVETPQPVQPHMVANCNKFHLVRAGDTCGLIAALYAVSVDDVILWNPDAGADCTTLWAGYYACVGIGG
ncbi:hypothetical protein CDD83_9173 [Cordyceps sp. RAO-2017]|nr:hypothetical protein CDD83_9173 [Cordyceps sp. RAO-2017]